MKNITPPRAVSLETALQNLAARLTGRPVGELPKTQEALVQYLAENLPGVEQLTEAAARQVLARLEAAGERPPVLAKGTQNLAKAGGSGPQEGAGEGEKPRRVHRTNQSTEV